MIVMIVFIDGINFLHWHCLKVALLIY